MLINFMAARDFYNPTEYYIKKNGYIEVPKINLNFWCYANKKEADADENKRPSVYIKWVKTFKNIDEAINTEITAANNWGGTTLPRSSQLNLVSPLMQQLILSTTTKRESMLTL